MALKRNWIGKDGNVAKPSLTYATEGLSPFMCIDMDEETVARINADADNLDKASQVTVADLQGFNTKISATVPDTESDFMLLLKRYANLNFALFSGNSPHFQCIQQVITALRAYSKVARQRMSAQTKATILWIILLQARKFSMGDMDVLAEFSAMHTSLCAKCITLEHADVPEDLYVKKAPASKKRERDKEVKLEVDKHKKQRGSNPNTWHPKLQAALKDAMLTAKNPSFGAIIRCCNKQVSDVYPLFSSNKICTPNAITGTCYNKEKCSRDHSLPSDDEVTKILEMVKPFIDSPERLARG